MNIKDENGGSQMGAGFSIEDRKKLAEAQRRCVTKITMFSSSVMTKDT